MAYALPLPADGSPASQEGAASTARSRSSSTPTDGGTSRGRAQQHPPVAQCQPLAGTPRPPAGAGQAPLFHGDAPDKPFTSHGPGQRGDRAKTISLVLASHHVLPVIPLVLVRPSPCPHIAAPATCHSLLL